MIYLDSAATSLLKPKSVGIAMHNALQTLASPGRGSHIAAMRAAEKVYEKFGVKLEREVIVIGEKNRQRNRDR